MSRFLILSEDGSGLGLALRLEAESHSVKMWIRDPLYKDVGKGLVDCACSYEFGQIIIPECIGFGSLLDIYRAHDVRVLGGSSFADHIEEDRELAEEIMHKAGVETPEAHRATSWKEAIHVAESLSKKSSKGKVVIKPEGKLSGIVPSYVASSLEDAVAMLKSYEAQSRTDTPEIFIQEFIEGVAVSTEGWFNGEDWVEGLFNHTLENKKTLNDDLGPSEGCAGNVVWSCDSNDLIVKQTLTKLTKTLREARYIGPFDINCVVNKEGVYALEFTPRFGYDAFPVLLYTLCDFNFGSFMDSCSNGDICRERLNQGFGAGIRIKIPHDLAEHESVSVRGLSQDELQWFYPYHLAEGMDGIESVKNADMLGVVCGFGDSIGEAFARAYQLCSKLEIRDLQYRSDLAEACLKDFRELQDMLSGDEESEGWIGVDLDGTLAKYSSWSEDIGEPIPQMIQRVKHWLAEGKEVRILTARGSLEPGKHEQLVKVYDWVKQHIGSPLEVTHKKDPLMIRLYDDRVRQVKPNTGELVHDGSRSSVGV